jgi:hypothetical protein
VPSGIPDPYDTEAHKAFQARQQSELQAVTQTVASMANSLTAFHRERAEAALRQDIDKAVEQVNDKVNHPNPHVVEAMLDAEYRANPKFKALFDNRAKNPVAWNNALGVMAGRLQKDLSVKVDPSLVAAQRARTEGQRQLATTASEPDNNPLEQEGAKLKGAEFDAWWQSQMGA